MNLKDLFLKRKSLIVTAVASLILGVGIGNSSAITQEQYHTTLSKSNEITANIEKNQSNILAKNNEFDELSKEELALQSTKDKLQEDQHLAKLEEEKKAKEEAERLAKEAEAQKAREEQERLAKDETARKAQEQIAIAQTQNNTSNSSPKPSSNGGGVPVNNGAIEQPKSKMVYKTKSGKKYHSKNNCGNTDPSGTSQITAENARSIGLSACSKCF